jgi:hypothetical protein
MGGDGLSVDQAVALRSHYARLASLYGERWVDALFDGRYRAAALYERAYREAARHCHVAGAQIRHEPLTGRDADDSAGVFPDVERTELPATAHRA